MRSIIRSVFLILFMFNYSFATKTDDIKQELELAKKLYKENKIELAIAKFEKILIKQPNNKTANYYVGKFYLDISPKIAMFYLKKVDSNVTLYNIKTIFGSSYTNNLNNDNSKVDAFTIYEFIKINYPTQIKNKKINNEIIAYNKNPINHNDKNAQLFSYKPSIKQKNNTYNLRYEYIRYENKNYLTKTGAGIKHQFNINQDLTSSVKLGVDYVDYLNKEDSSNDYMNYQIDIDTSYNLNDYFNLYPKIRGIITQNTNDKNADEYAECLANLGIDYNFKTYKFYISGGYFDRKYFNTNQSFNKKQHDKQEKYQFIIEKKLDSFQHHLKLQAKIEHIKNKSNITLYSYEKTTFYLNLLKNSKGIK